MKHQGSGVYAQEGVRPGEAAATLSAFVETYDSLNVVSALFAPTLIEVVDGAARVKSGDLIVIATTVRRYASFPE